MAPKHGACLLNLSFLLNHPCLHCSFSQIHISSFFCLNTGILHQFLKIRANYPFSAQFREKWGEQGNPTQQRQKQLSSDLILCEKEAEMKGKRSQRPCCQVTTHTPTAHLPPNFSKSTAEGCHCAVTWKQTQAWNNLSWFTALQVLHIFPFFE